MELKTLNTFIDIARSRPKKKAIVAAAEDEPVLSAIKDAQGNGIIDPILIGNMELIKKISGEIGYDLSTAELIEDNNPASAARLAVKMIREGKGQILIKGLVSSADYLRAILDKEIGLRTGALLSHIGLFEVPSYHKILAITDAAQNIAPDLSEKISIINNSVNLYHRLGIMNPKIAIIGAVETVNPKMQATLDAACLTMMNKRKQFKGCIIDGPLAFDNAISKEAAEHKGIASEVAGDPDIIFAPEIETANALYKCLTYLAGATVAAVILGAMVPIVLTSRSDTDRSKLMSIALAASY